MCFRFVSNNSFTGSISDALMAISALSIFRGAHNAMSLGDLYIESNNIQILDLSYNRATTFYGHSTSLEQLNLKGTGLSMNLDTTLSPFTNLKVVNLAENGLVGGLPSTLPATLEHLYLDGNFLRGSVPSSLISSAPLKTFSVSNNNLAGSLPLTFFTSSNALVTLNLANNSLGCFSYLPATLTTCDLSGNFLCPDLLSPNSSVTCVSSASVCYASALSCKNNTVANAACPEARPTPKSVCNTDTGVWEFPYWHSPAINSNLDIFNGTLVFPSAPSTYEIRGNVTVGQVGSANSTELPPVSSIVIAANARVGTSGDLVINRYSSVYVTMPDSSLISVVNPNSSASLPVVQVRGNFTVSSEATSISLDVRSTLARSTNLPSLIFLSSAFRSGSFASEAVLLPTHLNSTSQNAGLMCTGYFVSNTDSASSLQYRLSNSVALCRLPVRVIPPPLPPRGFDVGALIGSLFAAIVLAFVCFAAAMVANEDWHYVLPFNDG